MAIPQAYSPALPGIGSLTFGLPFLLRPTSPTLLPVALHPVELPTHPLGGGALAATEPAVEPTDARDVIATIATATSARSPNLGIDTPLPAGTARPTAMP